MNTLKEQTLKLAFTRLGQGGGTFASALKPLGPSLARYKPTVVVFNFGGNDAAKGPKGLDAFRDNALACVEAARAAGARPVLMTHQALDPRRNEQAAEFRKLYAEEMLRFAAEKGVVCVDTFHPIEALQAAGRADDPAYTVLKDTIHLTTPAYVAWGWFLYERLGLPPAASRAELTAAGAVTAAAGCQVGDVAADATGLAFTRADDVLPVLPPAELPPAKHVPLAAKSPYLLAVTGLPAASYEVSCEGKPVGTADAAALAKGVNLNELLAASGRPAPWAEAAKAWWEGRSLDQIGRTKWRFEVRRK